MSAHPSRRGLRFGVFTLDLSRCALQRGDEDVALRPQSFDVLRHLAEHSGRVVSKEELFQSVWAGLSVTDDSLVQCIMDIRHALGDHGRTLIKTVPRRGYLLKAEVAEVDTSAPSQRHAPFAAVEPSLLHKHPAIEAPIVRMAAPVQQAGTAEQRFQTVARITTLGPLVLLASTLAIVSAGLIATGTFGRSTPNSTAAHYAILGNAIFDKERSREANREAFVLFDKALALDPNLVSALVGYARAILVNVVEGWLHQSERTMLLSQAEVALKRAIKLEPGNGRAYQWYGILWRARGAPEQAIRSLEQAVVLMPTYAWVYADLARAKIDAGRADEAIQDFETAIRLGPKDIAMFIWYFQAGMAAVHIGEYQMALQWFQKSEDANPAYVHNMRPWRAIANAALGRNDEAHAFLAEHLAHSPGLTLARWNQRFPRSNATVAAQRERIAEVLRRLGIPEGA